jgi:hypothetical protein
MDKPMKRAIRKLLATALFGALSISASAATVNLGSITPPFSTSYGNSFASQAGQFVDDFVFSLSPAGTFNSFAATIDLSNLFQVSNLQARLYQGSGPFTPGVTPLEQAWSSAISSAPGVSGSILVINPINLAAATYTLELRGEVTGTAGGSYSGVLNVATLPVPEPGTYALMLAGLGLIGGITARGRKRL